MVRPANGMATARPEGAGEGVQGASPPPPDEAYLLGRRRKALHGGADSGHASWGLALSGGGIRSATLALGVLQAIAERRLPAQPPAAQPPQSEPPPPESGAAFRASLLSRFDLLSTVSGGGYVGAFLCSLFQPQRLRAASATPAQAADDAVAVLASGAPRRIHSGAYDDREIVHAPLAWLRENGRYLVPTGVGDAFYAAALGVRGWIGLHVVVGTVLLFVLALLAALRASLPGLADFERWLQRRAAGAHAVDPGGRPEAGLDLAWLAAAADSAQAAAASFPVWWSASFALALAPLAWALAAGVAFWMTEIDEGGRSRPFNGALAGMVAAIAAFIALAAVDRSLAGDTGRLWVWFTLGAVAAAGAAYRVVHAWRFGLAAKQRASLTRHLATALLWTLAVLAIAAVETMGQTAYLWILRRGAAPAAIPAAGVAALVWVVRQLATLGGGAAAKNGWLAKIPLPALGGAAGVLIFTAIAVAWSLALTALVWGGAVPAAAGVDSRWPWVLATAFGGIAVVTGRFPGFVNLSSLQSFYAARLTRAYLGATNRRRFEKSADDSPRARTAAEPIDGDNLELSTFYDDANRRLTTWAPLHIINVTLNKTVDPADQLVQRDRKGQPLAVLPWGYAVDGLQRRFVPQGPDAAEIKLPLSLGQWIGTSGAACSTGIGRETSLGMSLLMGAANVRLGTWWESGHGRRPAPSGWDRIGAAAAGLFKTQTYVSYEFRAHFHGMRREWQYLSDGGHFENTALYELLRPARRVGFIVACDAGADPDYRFDDLSNLIRLARIDLRVEVEVVDARAENLAFDSGDGMGPVFGRPGDFRPAPQARAARKPNPCALLLRARPCDGGATTWIVLLKPAWNGAAPADVVQYALRHPAFPQEPTTDQFFDEAQWESYRKLGHHLASRVLAPAVLDGLLEQIDQRQSGSGCAPVNAAGGRLSR